jgi:phosphopentomutase
MRRAVILVLDSLGIGFAPDADQFGDRGANTLGHIAQACSEGKCDTKQRRGPLKLPNMNRLGLAHACHQACGSWPQGMQKEDHLIGAFGCAAELSSGKDTPSGHWEIAGVPVLFEWGYFSGKENSFPQELLDSIIKKAELPGILGNCHASGTEILKRLGEEHLRTGKPIFYTSSDSVFQIAAHEGSFGLDRLLMLCEMVREMLEPYNIGRVIARPFEGTNSGNFARTGNRRDYSLEPPSPTVLQKLVDEKQVQVISVGKIADIYAHCGITKKIKAIGIPALVDATLEQMQNTANDSCVVFTNLVNFDSHYGHRRDVAGYAEALEYFDSRLPEIMELLLPEDILILTADHGCDPTWPGTDHTREYIPVILYGKAVKNKNLGCRETFADIGQTLATCFRTSAMNYGTNMLEMQ